MADGRTVELMLTQAKVSLLAVDICGIADEQSRSMPRDCGAELPSWKPSWQLRNG
jgi:hypothetical protein